MKENKSRMILFALAYGIVLLILFTSEQIDDRRLQTVNLEYDNLHVGIDFNALYEKDAVIAFVSGMFDEQGIRTIYQAENDNTSYEMSMLENNLLYDLAEESTTIDLFYVSYYYFDQLLTKSKQELSAIDLVKLDATFDLEKSPYKNTQALLETLNYYIRTIADKGLYDIYEIQADNAYDHLYKVRLLKHPKKAYKVMMVKSQDTTLYIDHDNDGFLDYSYVLLGTALEIKYLEKTSQMQSVYKGLNTLMDTPNDQEFLSYDQSQMMILRQEE